MTLKSAIKSLITPSGRSHGWYARRNRFRDALSRVAVGRAPVVVDGGCNKGDTIAEFLEACPTATVIGFEPIPAMHQRCQRRFAGRPGVTLHQMALGAEEGRSELRVTRNLVSSSLLDPSRFNQSVHGQAMEVVSRESVRVVALDGFVAQGIDVLKLDLQGGELAALRGAERHLRESLAAVVVEVEFSTMYEGQPLFADIQAFMTAHGFAVFNFYDPWTFADGRLESCDVLYVRA